MWRDVRFGFGGGACINGGVPSCDQRCMASVRDERRSNRLDSVRELRLLLRATLCGVFVGACDCTACVFFASEIEPRKERERRRACSIRRCWNSRSARLADRSWSCLARCSESMTAQSISVVRSYLAAAAVETMWYYLQNRPAEVHTLCI